MAAFLTNKLKVISAESFLNEFDITSSKNVPQDINIAATFVGTNTDYVTELYEYYLGRAPDAPGLAYWVNILNGGSASRRQIEIDTFLQGEGNVINTLYLTTGRPNKWTNEYIGDLSIASTFSGSNTDFVSNLYTSYYLREPTSAELNYWSVLVLDAGVSSRETVEDTYFVPGEDRNQYIDLGVKDYLYWDEIISLKRINAADLKLVVPRYNWTNGTIYWQYDDTNLSLLGNPFYVLNSEYNVYKCISNSTVASSVEPSGTSSSIFQTADGYRWKYLYTIESGDQQKFLTSNYMPIDSETSVIESATDGAIDKIIVINGGTGYTDNANVVVTITGDGDGTARANANVVNNVIVAFNVIAPGNNYRTATVSISGGNGSGAKARVVIGPQGGHGFDPKMELGASYVMASTGLSYNETDFPTTTYRRVGLLKSPILRSTNTVATLATINGNYSVNLLSNSNTYFSSYEYITGNTSGANAFVVSVSNDNKYIRYIQSKDSTNNFKSFVIGERITGSSSGAFGIVSIVNSPQIKHDSGEFIFIDNRNKIEREPSQTETFNIVIKF